MKDKIRIKEKVRTLQDNAGQKMKCRTMQDNAGLWPPCVKHITGNM